MGVVPGFNVPISHTVSVHGDMVNLPTSGLKV